MKNNRFLSILFICLLLAVGVSAQNTVKTSVPDTIIIPVVPDSDTIGIARVRNELAAAKLNEANMRMEIELLKYQADAADSLKSKVYPLQPPGCRIQYTTLFSFRKASAHKKTTLCRAQGTQRSMAIPILFLFQGTTAFCIGTNGLMPCAQSPDEADGLFCRQNCKKPKDLL